MFHPQGPSLRELIVQALSSTERGYDLLAPKFDYTPFRTPDVILETAARVLADGGPIGNALDLCCGTGAAMRSLRPICRGSVIGIDRSRGMLEEARLRLEDAPGSAAIGLVRGDALELPFRDCFDAVVSFGAFGHILERDEPRLLDSIFRALRPGGRFVFATADPPSALNPLALVARGFNAAMRLRNAVRKPQFVMYYLTFLLPRAQALLEEQGFEVRVHREVFPKPYSRLVLVEARRGG
ncbi:MAG: class I SAM-dependent methyltransferase [Myxococcaceae bacterium]